MPNRTASKNNGDGITIYEAANGQIILTVLIILLEFWCFNQKKPENLDETDGFLSTQVNDGNFLTISYRILVGL